MRKYKIRYAITRINNDGLRVIAGANQGHRFDDDKAAAERRLAAILSNNSTETLRQFYHKARVDAVECYQSGKYGDAVKTIIGFEKEVG